MWSNSNPFLNGPFEPLTSEKSSSNPVVIGEIPKDLRGALYRTGNSQVFEPLNPDRAHWFDGDGMTHAFILEDGTASYVAKWVETEGLQVERKAGTALYNGIYGVSHVKQGTLPSGAPTRKTVAGINIVPLAGKVLALHEQDDHYWELNPRTLETLGSFSFGDRYKGMLLTAHPHVDPISGETLIIAYEPESRSLTCFAVGADGDITSEHTVQMPNKHWIHDFIASRDWYIFYLSPLMNNVNDGVSIQEGKGALEVDLSAKSCAFLVNRVTGETRTIDFPVAFQVTHFLNAYQEGSQIVVDACHSLLTRTENLQPAGEIFPFAFPHVPEPAFGPPLIHRTVIDLERNAVEISPIEVVGEFLRVNPNKAGSKHRYGYLAAIKPDHPLVGGFNSLAKYDFVEGKVAYQCISEAYGMIPGEPVFVERPNAKSEDDGWLLALWWDPTRNASEMIILDALDITKPPVARVQLEHHIPLAFHGNWISWAELGM